MSALEKQHQQKIIAGIAAACDALFTPDTRAHLWYRWLHGCEYDLLVKVKKNGESFRFQLIARLQQW